MFYHRGISGNNRVTGYLQPKKPGTMINMKNYPVFGIDSAGDKEYFVSTADFDG